MSLQCINIAVLTLCLTITGFNTQLIAGEEVKKARFSSQQYQERQLALLCEEAVSHASLQNIYKKPVLSVSEFNMMQGNSPYVFDGSRCDFRFTYHKEFSFALEDGRSYINFFPGYESVKELNVRLMDFEGDQIEVEIQSGQGTVFYATTLSVNEPNAHFSLPLTEILNDRDGIYELIVKSGLFWDGVSFQYSSKTTL